MADQFNVVLVVVDGARADHLSCYGCARETTPFLDQVARDGVRFTNMIATAAATLPSHAALLTGLHAVTHGATDEHRSLPGRHALLSEHLKAAGYRTAAFCTNPWVSPETGFGRGFDAFFTQRYHNRLATRAVSYGRRAADALLRRKDAGARRTNRAFQRWIATDRQPFFALVHYNEAHLPFQPPPPYERIFLPKQITPARVAAVQQDTERYLLDQAELPEEDAVILTALYDGALRYVDQRLRELATILEARGDWDRTLFVLTADHGLDLGEHGGLGHAVGLYDTVLRVPLLLRCPPVVPQGFVIDELAQSTDVPLTILSLLGIPQRAGGGLARPLLDQGRATSGPAFAIAERFRPEITALQQRLPGVDVRALDVRTKAVRTKREKFIWRSDEANELYDLTTDPYEERNLIERTPDRGDALRRQLFDWLATVDKFDDHMESEPAGQQPGAEQWREQTRA